MPIATFLLLQSESEGDSTNNQRQQLKQHSTHDTIASASIFCYHLMQIHYHHEKKLGRVIILFSIFRLIKLHRIERHYHLWITTEEDMRHKMLVITCAAEEQS